MVMVVVFEFGVMRCQPLRRALVGSKDCKLCINKQKLIKYY
ncbi:acetyltransferase [Vibrio parahaemolyticus]